jgi:uncharacterized phage protein (TIGR02218 family)
MSNCNNETLTFRTYIWSIYRTDGVSISFTTHDKDIIHDGVQYHSFPSSEISNIFYSSSQLNEKIEICGLIHGNYISKYELECGLWGNAFVEVSSMDWLKSDSLLIYRGIVTSIKLDEKINSSVFILEIMYGDEKKHNNYNCSPTCRADLGDKRCSYDIESKLIYSSVVEVLDSYISIESEISDHEIYGKMLALTGQLRGKLIDISFTGPSTIKMSPGFLIDIFKKDKISLYPVCNKTFLKCASVFQNGLNFQGEPFVPGSDILVRYESA